MLLLLIASWPIGTWALRSQGRAAWRRLGDASALGRPPGREVLDGSLILLGGLLLIVPGFITDALGVFLLLPPTRALVRADARAQLPEPPGGHGHALHAQACRLRRRLHGDGRRPTAATPMSASRALAFGDLDAGIWGAAWIPPLAGPGPGRGRRWVRHRGPRGNALRRRRASSSGDLEGDGIEVIFSPSAPAVSAAESDGWSRGI